MEQVTSACKMVRTAMQNMTLHMNAVKNCETPDEGSTRNFSNFTIDRILNGPHFKTESEKLMTKPKTDGRRFDWLNYTRYNPPKLPKSSKRRQKTKRRPGRNPRVPFTPTQLKSLEKKFQVMKYLNNEDVIALCTQLDLPEHKIKIWFQNRRAREKRKSAQAEEYIDVMTIDFDRNNLL